MHRITSYICFSYYTVAIIILVGSDALFIQDNINFTLTAFITWRSSHARLWGVVWPVWTVIRHILYCFCVWNQSLVEASSQPTANIWLRRRRAMNFTKIVSTGQEHISNYILMHAMVSLRVGRGIVLRPAWELGPRSLEPSALWASNWAGVDDRRLLSVTNADACGCYHSRERLPRE